MSPTHVRTAPQRWRSLASRQVGSDPPGHLLDELRNGRLPGNVAEEHGVPRAWVDGVASFYDLLHGSTGERVCTGTACAFARGHQRGLLGEGVRCLGQCHAAPARTGREPPPIPRRSLVDPPVVLRHVLRGSDGWSDYATLPDGEAILRAVEQSGLRGRGGAAFPTAAKWKTARDTPAPRRYVVANGDEGDPGSYVDRLLLEEAPHSVLAGMKACALAVGATHGIVFIRGEYGPAQDAMLRAMDRAREHGVLGPAFDVELHSGAGSYVAGEETALLRAIEGLRAEPAPKPPYPAQAGLHGMPTVVQNVETLSVIPWVAVHHSNANAKAVCLSGCVRTPGVVEIRLGTSLRHVLEEGGGGPLPGRTWKMALVGGPLGTVIRADALDVPLSYEHLRAMGHGGVVMLDDTVSARRLAEHLMQFFAEESCGTCTPCRVGCSRLAGCTSAQALQQLCNTMAVGSLCGFGQGVGRPLMDLVRHFPGEMFP